MNAMKKLSGLVRSVLATSAMLAVLGVGCADEPAAADGARVQAGETHRPDDGPGAGGGYGPLAGPGAGGGYRPDDGPGAGGGYDALSNHAPGSGDARVTISPA